MARRNVILVTDPNQPQRQDTNIVLDALDFVEPQHQHLELFKGLSPYVEDMLKFREDEEVWDLDPILEKIDFRYSDAESVGAYYNLFVKPNLGTRPAMEIAFSIIGADAQLIEWFESETPIPAFKFVTLFEEYPGQLDFERLIDLIYTLKNERSHPTTIRMPDCADIFVLDYSYLDTDYLSDSEGYKTAEGILLCLYDSIQSLVDISDISSYYFWQSTWLS